LGDYSHSNPSNRIRARRLLETLMPRAMEMSQASEGFEPAEASDLFKALQPHLRMDSFQGVHIYPGKAGGWHADIVLSGLPTGLPSLLGTPSTFPCSTRGEAEHQALAMLAVMIGLARENDRSARRPEADVAVFEYEDLVLRVPILMLESIKATAGTPDQEYVAARLAEIRKELTDAPRLDMQAAMKLDDEGRARLYAVAAMALLAGFVRWPIPEDRPPPSHGRA